MAKPTTVAEVWDRFKLYVTLLNEIDKFGRSNTGNYNTLYDTLAAQTEGEFLPGLLGPIARHRGAFTNLLSTGELRKAGGWFAAEFGKVLGAPESSQQAIMARVRTYMAELGTPQTLNRREMTFGAVTAVGSPTGTGTIHKITVDEYGYPLENVGPDLLTFRCVRDQGLVNKHEEEFEVRGADADKDVLTETGSGLVEEIAATSANGVTAYLQNPSFTSYSGTGASLAFTGWTLSSAVLFEVSTTTYKSYVGEGTGYSLKFLADANVLQQPTEASQTRYDATKPWFFGAAVYRGSTADGTLTLQLGGVTRDVTVSSLSNNAWTYLTLPATIGQSNWYRAWKQNNLTIKFTLASRTTGYVLLDDICFAPMQNIGGHWYLIVGGPTPFIRDDSWTITNALEAARAKIAYWAYRMGWPNFPTVTGGTEIITDPADPS